MTLLTNPVMLRMSAVSMMISFTAVVGIMVIRRMRRSFLAEGSISQDSHSSEAFSLYAYNGVIQQLKQQKHELLSSQQSERRRAKTSENISAAVLSNLSSGVIFFTPNGLVRQANAASKQILGYASPAGMSAVELFRQAVLISPQEFLSPAHVVQASLIEKTPSGRLRVEYVTPSGLQKLLEVTVTPVESQSAGLLGAACLISDQTEMAAIRKRQELRGELAAEMALELRNSLNTISGYARQLASGDDPELTRRVAADIASEASHLDHTIGGFLAESKASTAAHA